VRCTFNVRVNSPAAIFAGQLILDIDLQELRHLTKQLLDTLYSSTAQIPYSVRLFAREALLALRVSIFDVACFLLELTRLGQVSRRIR